MIRRLYKVSATVTAVILATSETEAEERFKSDFGDIISDQSIDAQSEGEITAETQLPDEWSADCLPYGPTGNTLTIGECLDLVPPPVVRDDKTADMFANTEGVPA
ncbi:MAG: hypothetical protein K2X55_04825 [Burkholderiaceae bacterium]|nr:hypothetical protein [Burkholderiaceae bacterium]